MTTDYAAANQKMEDFRFFPLGGKDGGGRGDRLLQPWILIVIGRGRISRSQLKRSGREISRFFTQPVLREALALAGADSNRLLEEHLYDSAATYIRTSREDPGYNSTLFGLIKLKEGDRVRKLATDIHENILGRLLLLEDCVFAAPMIMAMVRAYKDNVVDGEEDFQLWREGLAVAVREKLDDLIGQSQRSMS